MSEPTLLEVTGLSKTYHVGRRAIEALKAVSFDLLGGTSLAITGYSGSGKSTLLGLIGGLDRPTSGDVVLGGRSYAKLSEGGLTALRKRKIGFVFQTFNLLPALTASENVFLAGRVAGLRAREAGSRTRELLNRVGVAERANHLPAQLSGGEQQRVAIARALISRPALLLADEPTGDLDSENGAVVAELMFELCRTEGSGCIIATHNLDLAARADRRMAMRDGVLSGGGS